MLMDISVGSPLRYESLQPIGVSDPGSTAVEEK